MNQTRQFIQKFERAFGACARTILAPLIIVDCHVLNAGGFSLLGGIVPIIPIIFLLYILCWLSFVVMAAGFAINRKFIRLFSLVFLIAGTFVYANFNAEQIKVRQLASARDALDTFLSKPQGNSVWYHSAQDESDFRVLQSDPRTEISYIKASPVYHTYHFNLARSGASSVRVEVLLLRGGKRFIVYRNS